MALEKEGWMKIAVLGIAAAVLAIFFLANSYGWFERSGSDKPELTPQAKRMLTEPQIKDLASGAAPSKEVAPAANQPPLAQATPAVASPAITPSQIPANASTAKLEERMGRAEERINRVETKLNEYQPCLDRLCKNPGPAAHSTKTKIVMRKPTRRTAARSSVPSKQAVPQGPVMTGSCPGCGQWNPYDQPHQPASGQVSPRFFDQRIN